MGEGRRRDLRLKVDLHIHTTHSRDSCLRVEEAIRCCRDMGLDGFALTDHDTVEGLKEAEGMKGDLILIPGLEVTADGGHILALNVSELIPPKLSMMETVDRVREQGGIAILAHPSSLLKTFLSIEEIAQPGFTALEVANSMSFPYRWTLRRSLEIAERLRLPKTGGSDAHMPEAVGRAYTVIEANSRDVDDLIRAVERGYTEPFGEGLTPRERFILLSMKIFNPVGRPTQGRLRWRRPF